MDFVEGSEAAISHDILVIYVPHLKFKEHLEAELSWPRKDRTINHVTINKFLIETQNIFISFTKARVKIVNWNQFSCSRKLAGNQLETNTGQNLWIDPLDGSVYINPSETALPGLL